MQLKSKNSCEVMPEKYAFFGSKPKQTVYIIVRRDCTLIFGVPALVSSQTLPLPLVLCLVQVFAQVLGLLLWL